MKRFLLFIVFISVFLIVIAGCSNKIENQGNSIIVEKRIGEEDRYEPFKEITDGEAVQKIKDILNGVSWKNGDVKMATPGNYKFHFEGESKQSKSDKLIYYLWVSPNKDSVHLVIEGESKLAYLSEIDSAELFETLTGGKITDEN